MINIETILAGLFAGVTYALSGFIKSNNEAFDYIKFVSTVAVGIVAGIGIALTGLAAENVYAYLISMGVVPVIQNLVGALAQKILYRPVPKP